MTAEDLPKLKGLPADLHQMVAVSDAVNRPQHDFSRPWEDDAGAGGGPGEDADDGAGAAGCAMAAARCCGECCSGVEEDACYGELRRGVRRSRLRRRRWPLLDEDLKRLHVELWRRADVRLPGAYGGDGRR